MSEARVGLTELELRSFFLRGLTPSSSLVEEPYEGPEVFLVADALLDGFHFGPGTYFTDGSKLYLDPRRREVGWGFLLCHSIPPITHRSLWTSHA